MYRLKSMLCHTTMKSSLSPAAAVREKMVQPPVKEHSPYLVINDTVQIEKTMRMFRPHALHTHLAILMPFKRTFR